MKPRLQIDFGVYLFLAAGLLLLPLEWMAGAVLAAAVHEGCHLTAARLLGVACSSLRVTPSGAVLEMGPMTRREEFICAAAGPAGSLALLCLARLFPELAVCGGMQGIFNLLPVGSLDGGRMLSCIVGNQRLCRTVGYLFLGGVCLAGFWVCRMLDFGIWAVILPGMAAGKAFLRKIPCKAEKLRVQ